MKSVSLRAYQKEARDKALKFWESKGVSFRLNMCVGSGKTFTSIAIIESKKNIKNKNVVVMFHTINLMNQFERELNEHWPEKKRKGKWYFTSYQSLSEGKIPTDSQGNEMTGEVEVLIVDEAHQGGLKKSNKKGSHEKIIKKFLKPKKILCLTATDFGLDDELYGKKTNKNTYVYTYKKGLEEGFVNEAKLITMHTGLSQDCIAPDDTEFNIEGDSIDSVVMQAKEKSVSYQNDVSSNAIETARLISAISVYLDKELGKNAVFFVKRQSLAEEGVRLFSKMYVNKMIKSGIKKYSTGKSLARFTHSGVKNSQAIINDFCKGKFKVLFSVSQIKEGFNYKSLEVGFDLCPSTTNEGRVLLQKLGRVTRTYDGKPASRFYIMMAPPASPNKFSLREVAESDTDYFNKLTEEEKEILDNNLNMMASIKSSIENEGLDDDEKKPDTEMTLDIDLKAPESINVDTIEGDDSIRNMLDQLGLDKLPQTMIVTNHAIVTKARGEAIKEKHTLSVLLGEAQVDDPDFCPTVDDLCEYIETSGLFETEQQ